VVAFAPAGIYPVAVATFALLIYLWVDASPKACFWTGFWFGLGLFGAGVSWVYVSMTQFGGMPAPLAALGIALFSAFLALFPAAAGWLQARIPAPEAVRASLLIPASWTLFEWLRSWLFTGFPWLTVGYAAADWPLQGYAPLAGVFGVSFVTLSLSGLASSIVRGKRIRVSVAAVLALVIAGEARLRARPSASRCCRATSARR